MDYIKNTLRLKMSRRRLSERGTSNQPMRCPVCGKIFAVCINYAKVKEEYRLDEDVFGGIPIEECVCGECCG